MPDNKSKRGGQDRSRINMHEDYEVRYWTQKLGVTKEQLQQAVNKAGTSSAKKVEKELAGYSES